MESLAESTFFQYNKNWKEGQKMRDIRQKINDVLDKIESDELLLKIYRFAQYVYIHVQK